MLFITGEELHTEGLLLPPHPPLLHGLPEELHPPELQGLPAFPTDEIKYVYLSNNTNLKQIHQNHILLNYRVFLILLHMME